MGAHIGIDASGARRECAWEIEGVVLGVGLGGGLWLLLASMARLIG
jgi:hypothetical protein